jgi:hypothetical protein
VRTLATHIWGLLHRRAFGAAITAVVGGHATAIGMRAFFIVRHKLALIFQPDFRAPNAAVINIVARIHQRSSNYAFGSIQQ